MPARGWGPWTLARVTVGVLVTVESWLCPSSGRPRQVCLTEDGLCPSHPPAPRPPWSPPSASAGSVRGVPAVPLRPRARRHCGLVPGSTWRQSPWGRPTLPGQGTPRRSPALCPFLPTPVPRPALQLCTQREAAGCWAGQARARRRRAWLCKAMGLTSCVTWTVTSRAWKGHLEACRRR